MDLVMTDDTETNQTRAAEAPADTPAEAPIDAALAGARMVELEAEHAKLKDQLLRALAEQENLRKRAEREREDAAKYGAAQIAKDLLSVADNLRRALESGADAASDEARRNLIAGVEATERELIAAFERRGIRRLDPSGEPFDPNFHQAMFEVETAEHPAGTVMQVLQPGYVIHDRLLRPALVGVAKTPGQGRVDTKA